MVSHPSAGKTYFCSGDSGIEMLQVEQPWQALQVEQPLSPFFDFLSPWQSHRPRKNRRRTAHTAHAAIRISKTTVDGVIVSSCIAYAPK